MREILWRSWDPLGLAGIAPDDEYDAYARVLASKLRHGRSTADIADYLASTLAPSDQLPSNEWLAQSLETAEELIEWYRASAAPS